MNETSNNQNNGPINNFPNGNMNGNPQPGMNPQVNPNNQMGMQPNRNMGGQPTPGMNPNMMNQNGQMYRQPNMNGQPNPGMNPQQNPYMNGQPTLNGQPMPNSNYPMGNAPKKNNNVVKALIIGLVFLILIGLAVGAVVLFTTLKKNADDVAPAVTEETEEISTEEVEETTEEVTEETTVEEETETIEADLADSNIDLATADLQDFVISLEGTTYQLPITYTELTEAGWSISTSSISEDDMIAANDYEMARVSNGAVEIYSYVFNASGNTKALKDCNVGGFEIYAKNNLDFTLPQGITCLSTVDEITEAYGVPESSNTYDDYTSLRYSFDTDARKASVSFMIYDTKTTNNSIDIEYFAATADDETEVSTVRPDYLDSYVAPSKLSSDVTETQFELDGVLYQFPCPLSEFTDNGWSIASKDVDSIPSMNRISYSVKIKKGNNEAYIDMCNFSMTSELVENSAVCGIEFDPYYMKDMTADYVKFPGGLNMGSSPDEVEAACTNFEKYEGSSYVSYSYSEYSEIEKDIHYSFGSGLNPTPTVRIKNVTWTY